MRDTIVFDGEGVVIDSEKLWDRGQQEFLRRRGATYDRAKIKHLLAGRSMVEGVRVLQAEYGFGGDPETLARERIEIVEDLFCREADFVPGFEKFYARIRHNFKTCVATMMPKGLLDIVIARLKLRNLFGDHIYCPDSDALPGKPAPDLFLYAARQLQSVPANCIVIEDSPIGIEAARRAAMYCIGITTTFAPDKLTQADIVVRSFDEIELPADQQTSVPCQK
jgi:beta-phosphoglucomutase-like phosphatase (HAD superfamily)